MEVKTKQTQLQKQADELNSMKDKFEKDMQDQFEKIERAQRSFQSKFNNVKSVKGDAF